jgi:ATP-dependent helicase/nuclease subunit A
LEQKLAWRYSFRTATVEPAKTSVSALRRRAAVDRDEDAVVWRPRQPSLTLSGIEVGAAHHLLLENVPLADAHNRVALAAEARRLADVGLVTRAQMEALDLEAIAAFWGSDAGREIRAREAAVHRELPFTARFSLAELIALDLLSGTSIGDGDESSDEWVIVQGYVDLAVIDREEIWVLDFKTDRVADAQSLVNAYGPQLRLYALALARIHSRPVTRLWLHALTTRQTISLPPLTTKC